MADFVDRLKPIESRLCWRIPPEIRHFAVPTLGSTGWEMALPSVSPCCMAVSCGLRKAPKTALGSASRCRWRLDAVRSLGRAFA